MLETRMSADPTFELRPRSIGELLDLIFRVYRRGFASFATIGVAVSLINLLLVMGGTYFAFSHWVGVPAATTVDPAALVMLYAVMIPVVAISVLVYSAGAVTITAVAGAMFRGQPSDVRSALRGSLSRIPAGMATGILMFLSVGMGAMCCLVPGLVLGVLLALAIPLTWLERLGPLAAMSRSYELVYARGPRGLVTEANWFRVLCVGLITVVVFYVLQLLSAVPVFIVSVIYGIQGGMPQATPLGPQAAPLEVLLPLQVLSALIQGFFVAIPVIPWTIVYYDIRTRHEGLDLELAAAGAEPASEGV